MSRREAAGWAVLSLAVLFCLFVQPFGAGALAAEPLLSADEAFRRAEDGRLTIVDVRSPSEWRDTGVPAGASTVTIHNRRGPQGFLDEILRLTKGDRAAPLALICARGTRSAAAAAYLRGQGFTNIHDVSEGMLGRGDRPGWLARKLPVEPCERCP